MHLILPQRSLRLSSVLFILFTLYRFLAAISTTSSSSSWICSSPSDMLLLIASRVFLISVIVFFVSLCLFFHSSQLSSVQSLSHVRLCDPMDTRLLCPWDFLGKSTGVGCHFLLQGSFPAQGSNPGLPHCRQTLYCLSQPRKSIPYKNIIQ